MHDLIQKYRDNELSAEDVRKLRKLLDGMSDNELAGILEKDWEVYKADGEQRLPTGMESRLRRNIHSVVGKVHSMAYSLCDGGMCNGGNNLCGTWIYCTCRYAYVGGGT